MLCSMQITAQPPLSITRHAVQYIWQTTLSCKEQKPSGLLGSQQQGIVNHAIHIPHWQALKPAVSKDMTQITQDWQTSGVFLSGIFQTTHTDLETMQAIEKNLQPYISQHLHMPFIHFCISFDTKGVLESEAWIIQNNQAVQLPISLTEDGQSATKS